MKELVCPECSYKNEPGSTFCEECGVILDDNNSRESEEHIPPYKSSDVILDRYEVVKVMNNSPSDTSYLALDRENDDVYVWIKQKKTGSETDAEFKRLEPLFEKLKENTHKNVVRTLDLFKGDESVFIIFENVDGHSLQQLMDEGSDLINQENVLDWAIQAADGLNFLHSHLILHRDIQPAHLLLTDDGRLKISGFSRIHSMAEDPKNNEVTEGYSPPEAYGLMGGRVGRRSDIFSLGATLYSLLSGKRPGVSREDFFQFSKLSVKAEDVDSTLEEIILKAVNKEPVKRYDSAGEMLKDLRQLKKKGLHSSSEEVVNYDFEIDTASHVGKVRKINQDACLVNVNKAYEQSNSTAYTLLVVADGMGGEVEGDKASSLAVRVIAREVLNSYLPVLGEKDTRKLYPPDPVEKAVQVIQEAVMSANREVYEYSRRDPARRGMGSTISVAIIVGKHLCICHAGDTRVYSYSVKKGLQQLTEDHSLVGRLVRLGQLTREEALNSPQRSAIYRALGTTSQLEMDVYRYVIEPGDYLLLCSDGVWEYFPDEELARLIRQEKTPDSIVKRLIRTCLDRGADDNATVITLRVKGAEKSSTLVLEKLDSRKKKVKKENKQGKETTRKNRKKKELEEKKREKEELSRKRWEEEREKKDLSPEEAGEDTLEETPDNKNGEDMVSPETPEKKSD